MRGLILNALLTAAAALFFACGSDSSGEDAFSTPTPSAIQESVRAEVTDVIDGITIDVEIDGKPFRVRYLGLDLLDPGTPEDGRSLLEEALQFNRFLVSGHTVELVSGVVRTDLNGNLLRYVYVDGEMVNKTIVTNGHAKVSEFPALFRYQSEFLIAEDNARNSRRGVWKTLPPPLSGPTPDTSTSFGAGTLPTGPGVPGGQAACEYSNNSTPMIKGNVDATSGERQYHLPGGLFYNSTVVDESKGDRWFCTEMDALGAGWSRSHR